MGIAAARREAPAGAEHAAALLREASERGEAVRFSGGRTKLGWAPPGIQPAIELSTTRLDRVLEHNAGDLTAVIEAGAPLARVQEVFARAGQMLALDPPDPGGATVGGIVAANDSGPVRARFGSARDLVVGIRVALPDGSLARAGGKVIKNVAGYDLAKLFTGSFGTLGLIVELSVRLHPRPRRTVTAAGGTADPGALARAALELSHAPLEALSLDWRWGGGDGALLARFGGVAPREQAEAALRLMGAAGLRGSLVEADGRVWELQREGQRSPDGTVVRVSGLPGRLGDVLSACTRLGGRGVGRAGLGLSWLRLDERSPEDAAGAVEELRRGLSPAPCAVLDAPPELGRLVEPWPEPEPGALALMRRVKERFDPAGICNPGALAGGI
jgi:glycolate oxidase FAD binding subunit